MVCAITDDTTNDAKAYKMINTTRTTTPIISRRRAVFRFAKSSAGIRSKRIPVYKMKIKASKINKLEKMRVIFNNTGRTSVPPSIAKLEG